MQLLADGKIKDDTDVRIALMFAQLNDGNDLSLIGKPDQFHSKRRETTGSNRESRSGEFGMVKLSCNEHERNQNMMVLIIGVGARLLDICINGDLLEVGSAPRRSAYIVAGVGRHDPYKTRLSEDKLTDGASQ